MPSSYSPRLRLELQATGENRSTWGVKANNDFSLIEVAIAGAVTVTIPNANYTLTTANGTADEARNAILILEGTLTAKRTVTIPSVSKIYVIKNNTTGGFDVDIKTSAGLSNTLTIQNGTSKFVWSDGTSVFFAETITPVNLGGTGATTVAGAQTNLSVDNKVVFADKATNYTPVLTDNNAVHRYTAAATASLTAAATLGANWHYSIIAYGGDVTVDPNGSETIDGYSSVVVRRGTYLNIFCNGTAFYTENFNLAGPDYVVGREVNVSNTTTVAVNAGDHKENYQRIIGASAINKLITGTWTVGNNNGGLDTGTVLASRTYFIFDIVSNTTGVPDVLISLSPTAPTVPGGYSLVGRIGIASTNASSQLLSQSQIGNRLSLLAPVLSFTGSGSSGATLVTMAAAPQGISVDLQLGVTMTAVGPNADGSIFMWDYNVGASATGGTGLQCRARASNGGEIDASVAGINPVRCNTSGQVYRSTSIANNMTFTGTTYGWIDFQVPRNY